MQVFSSRKSFAFGFPLRLALVVGFSMLSWIAPQKPAAEVQEEGARFCQGFLYCKETKGDTTSTQAFLYLYSTEERGTYSRLTVIPFYSREINPATDYLRRSVLWPFGISETKGDASYFQILPLYWSAADPTVQYTFLLPLYFDYARGDRSFTHLIPLYGHHRRGELYHRYYVLGPLAIATYDKQTDLKEWDILFPLFHYGADHNGYETRVFPLYFSGEDRPNGSWYRHLLPFYGRSVTPHTDLSYLFPLYGTLTDAATQETRTSAIGLPPIPQATLPALALYEHAASTTAVSDRLFPIYRYAHALIEDRRQLDILALFQLRTGPALTAHRLFPLYYYESDLARDLAGWSILGYDQFSLAGYGRDSRRTWHQLIPLYRTTEDLTTQTRQTDVLGIGPLSFFRYWANPQGFGHRFLPLYDYDHPDAEEWHISALFSGPLSLYRHDEKGTAIQDRLFPLYDWRRNGDWREMGVLGVSEFSMFHRETGPTRIAHRLFPLYRYRHDLAADDVSMETLFLHRHHSTPEQGDDRFLLLWDAAWQRQQPGWELDLFGIKPVTWFHHESDPSRTADRLFPLYGYQSTPADEWRLSLLGFQPRERAFAWSLYEQGGSPNYFLTRLFPLYRFERNDATKEVNWSALLIYRHMESETRLLDTLPPLHEYERDDQTGKSELNLLGLKPVTLFKAATAPDERSSYLLPLYEYDRRGAASRLSLIGWPKIGGIPTFSLFEKEDTPSSTAHRFFPLYRYERDDEAKTRNWEALLLWWHRENEQRLRDVFLPMVDIEHDRLRDLREIGILGFRPLTYFKYRSSPTELSHYATLLYHYKETGASRRFSALGLPHFDSVPAFSLFAGEQTPSVFRHRFFPLYRYERDEAAKTRNWEALLLWWHRETESHVRNIFLPLTDIERDGTDDSSRMSLIGLPKIGSLPPLTLFNWEQTPSLTTHRFFPVYQYTRDDHAQTLNWQALFLWWHQQSEFRTRNILLPLADMEQDSRIDSRRVSLIGLPKIGGLPPLTLFNWEQTLSLTTHRFFPVYQYTYDQPSNATTWNALWLYWHHSNPNLTQDTFFPIGSIRRNSIEQTWNVSALGIEPASLIQISGSPTSIRNRFSPLWDYDREGSNWGLSFAGIGPLSFFSHTATADRTSSYLFPLWLHENSPTESRNIIAPFWSDLQNHQTQERQLGALGIGPFSLYYRQQTPAGMTARLFPVWSYEYEEATEESRTGMLGIPPLSLYYGHTRPTGTDNRLFPFFRYTNDVAKDESEFWFLWPLFDHKTAQGRTTETSLLWWLFDYRSPKADEWEYWVLGHPPIAMYMRTVSPTRTLVEVNPIIPGWRREYVEGVGTSWALFGGLIGMEAMPDGTHKLQLLWLLKL